ncbi:MAG: hypothetical protein U1E76_07295 [Planctomycetota bacterium]
MRRKKRSGAAPAGTPAGEPGRHNGTRGIVLPKQVQARLHDAVKEFLERECSEPCQDDRDVAQEVVDRMTLAIARGEEILNLGGFVRAVKHRVTADLYRRRRQRMMSIESVEHEPAVMGDFDRIDLLDLAYSVVRKLARMGELAMRIVLLHAAGYSFPQIARTVGITAEAARYQSRRAVECLRRAPEFRGWLAG